MELLCEHCGQAIGREPFHVMSEAAGIVFLNMIVCAPCAEEAGNLGLKVTQLDLSDARAKRRAKHASEI